MDCSPPGSSAHGILQAGTLKWTAMPSSRGLMDLGIEPMSPALADRFFTTSTNWEAQNKNSGPCGCMGWEMRLGLPHGRWEFFGCTTHAPLIIKWQFTRHFSYQENFMFTCDLISSWWPHIIDTIICIILWIRAMMLRKGNTVTYGHATVNHGTSTLTHISSNRNSHIPDNPAESGLALKERDQISSYLSILLW